VHKRDTLETSVFWMER